MKSTANPFGPLWDYTSKEIGPDNWACICEEFGHAASHPYQSPISLSKKIVTDIRENYPIDIHYQQEIFNKFENNYTLQLLPSSQNNYLLYQNEEYFLDNIHFHLPSEHLLENEHAQIEFHLVHRSATGKLMVVGSLFNVADLMKAKQESDFHWYESEEHFAFNPSMFIPKNKNHFSYQGSLTTPPTIGEVNWLVFEEILTIDRKHFDILNSFLSSRHNNRPVQELNGRTISYYAN